MANARQELAILIKTEISKALKDFQRSEKAIDDQGKAADRSGRRLKQLDNSYRKLTASLGAYISVATALKALGIADDWNTLQQRVQAATKETNDYIGVSKELYAITQRNGAALADTVATFQRLFLARKEINATNEELLKVTETVLQLGRKSGATTAAMQAGTLQFAQAMSSGVVRAEELNSIVENLPELANRIADGMGMTAGELRQAVLDGKVLSRDVFNTLLDQSADIAEEMGGLPLKLRRSWSTATTALGKFLSKMDDLTGVTDFISKALQGWAGILDKASEPEYELEKLQRRRLGILDEIAQKEAYIASFRGPEFARQDMLDELEKLKQELVQIENQLKRNNKEAVEFFNAAPSTEKPSGSNSSNKPGRNRKKTDPNESTVRSLELEAATYGETAEAALLYQLRIEGATEAQIERARAALESIRLDEEFAAAVEASEEAVKKQNEAYREWRESLDEAARRIRDTLDPLEPLRRELEELNVLLNAGKLSWEEWAEATINVQERIDELVEGTEEATSEMDQFAIQAARNIQGAFADFLFDPFNDGIQGMLRGFVQAVHRMVSEALAAKLADKLFGKDFSTGGDIGGIFGDFIGGIKSFLFHQGGIVGAGGTMMRVSPLAFANAPRYHAGGIAGLAPDEVPAVLRKGEEVLTETNPRHINNAAGGKMGVNVTIVDNRDSLGSYLSSSEGNWSLIAQIERNSGTIKRLLSI